MFDRCMRTLAVVLIACLYFTPLSARQVAEPAHYSKEWTMRMEPFRIAGNLYYVGTYELACYLITTPEGHFLLNTGAASSATVIKENIEKLGFKIKDVRILLTNQAHYDHVGALAAVKKMSGARFIANSKDAQVMVDGGQSDYLLGGPVSSFEPVKPDGLLNDRDSIRLGGTTVTALHHPGHTKGSTSYLVTVHDNERSYRVFLANMPSIIIDKTFSETTTYPGMADDYVYTLTSMENAQFDLWVAAHASQFDLHKKYKSGDAYNPRLFADRTLYLAKLADCKAAFEKKKAEENK